MENTHKDWLKGTVKVKWKGGLGWNLIILGVDRDSWEFYDLSDVPVSRNWYKTVSNLCENYIYKILYKNRRFKQIIFSKYATNLKTTISQRSLKNLGLDQLLKCLGFSLYPPFIFFTVPGGHTIETFIWY